MSEQERQTELDRLNAITADIHSRYMRIACRELRAVPTLRISELGIIVGGTTDYVGALLRLAAMGQETAEIICTAATATLMTECESRSREGNLLR